MKLRYSRKNFTSKAGIGDLNFQLLIFPFDYLLNLEFPTCLSTFSSESGINMLQSKEIVIIIMLILKNEPTH